MTLLEAFRSVGPLLDNAPRQNGLRSEAGSVLSAALQRQSKFLWREVRGRTDVLDDAAQDILKRLIVAGPRGVRAADPVDDEGVERWLRTALLRAVIDRVRRHARDSRGGNVDPTPPDGPDRVAERRQALGRAWTVFDNKVLPEIPAAARKAIEELARIARGEKSFEAAVDEEQAENGGTRQQARQRLYTRYSRALKAVVAAAAALVRAGKVTEEELRWVLRILDVLRLGGGHPNPTTGFRARG